MAGLPSLQVIVVASDLEARSEAGRRAGRAGRQHAGGNRKNSPQMRSHKPHLPVTAWLWRPA